MEPKVENNQQFKSYLQDLQHVRKMQAQRSVLMEVMRKDDIPYAVAHCEKYGSIVKAFSYSGENENVSETVQVYYLAAEFYLIKLQVTLF